MKIVVIGGGFAGLSALAELCPHKKAQVLLFDCKKTFDFLPCVPDIIGRGVRPAALTADLSSICSRMGCVFRNESVERVDCRGKLVITASGESGYDYLLIASGAQTNFYGNEAAERKGYTLYTVEDAERLLSEIKKNSIETFIVSGGGYTGVEAATSLRRYFDRHGLNKKIILVELREGILKNLPAWMQAYATKNLARMRIEVKTKTTVADARDGEVSLTDGRVLDRALLIWSAGMRTSDYVRALEVKQSGQGRISVDSSLMFGEYAFAAGDAAYFVDNGEGLRMAVQFSIAQGAIAARNIINSAEGRPLYPYKPIDLGYVIPMANNRSCGILFSRLRLKGVFPTFLHYCMCLYRSYGWKNRLGLARDILS